jgi:hypothetical protein
MYDLRLVAIDGKECKSLWIMQMRLSQNRPQVEILDLLRSQRSAMALSLQGTASLDGGSFSLFS